MPVYDYRCNQCQHVFEVRRSMTEVETIPVCPACDGTQTTRIYTPLYVVGAPQTKSCGDCSVDSPSACASCRGTR